MTPFRPVPQRRELQRFDKESEKQTKQKPNQTKQKTKNKKNEWSFTKDVGWSVHDHVVICNFLTKPFSHITERVNAIVGTEKICVRVNSRDTVEGDVLEPLSIAERKHLNELLAEDQQPGVQQGY